MTKKLTGGRIAIYWYRYRGGPLLIRFEGRDEASAQRAEAAGAVALSSAYALRGGEPIKAITLRDVMTLYRAAPDGFLKLATSTRSQWTRWLDQIVLDFGDLPTKALNARGIRRDFLAWRDKYAATPRTADYGMQVLKRLLSFAVDRDFIDDNPAEGIGSLYKANRADQIVESDELEAVLANVTPAASRVIRLAAATGMRRGDLVALQWDHVLEDCIEFATSKSGGTRRVIVPLFSEAREVIEELRTQSKAFKATGRIPSAFLLTTRRGTPWTEDAVTQAFIRGAKLVGVNKHFHDLRGTAATRFVRAQLTDEEVADLMGWEPTKVRGIRRRYVDPGQIARGLVERVERSKRAAKE